MMTATLPEEQLSEAMTDQSVQQEILHNTRDDLGHKPWLMLLPFRGLGEVAELRARPANQRLHAHAKDQHARTQRLRACVGHEILQGLTYCAKTQSHRPTSRCMNLTLD